MSQHASSRFFALPYGKLVLCLLAYGTHCVSAQTYTYTQLSTVATSAPATDGTNAVFVDAGGIEVTPFGGGSQTTLVPATATLPDGLGAATSLTAYGAPFLQNGVVYFGAKSSTGSGYFSVPVTGGSITKIVDSNTLDSSGRSVQAYALQEELQYSFYLGTGALTPPSVATNLFIPASGGAVFSAALYNAATKKGDVAVMSLSSTGTLSTVVDTALLSGCGSISNFATDGNLYAVWVLSSSYHVQLLENNAPTLSCSNVLVDLGVQGTAATGVLPGQPSSGYVQSNYFAPSTVIDSGYIYFSAAMTLSSTTTNAGGYSGIFRIQPGGSLQQVITTNTTALGSPGSVDALITAPLWVCSSFGVRGNYVVLSTCLESHYAFSGGLYADGYFYYNQSTQGLQQIAKAGTVLAQNTTFYTYNLSYPSQVGLTPSGLLAFGVTAQGYANYQTVFQGVQPYSVNLLATGAATTTSAMASPSPAVYGNTVSLTATVTTSGASPLAGSVFFSDTTTANGVVNLGSAPVTAGKATVTASLAGGTHTITAMYAGDTNNATSTGTASLTINPIATTAVTLTTSTPSITLGGFANFTATVTGVTGLVTPTGSFALDEGTTAVPASGTLTAGTEAVSTPLLSFGTHTLYASYSGDNNYLKATTSTVTVTVMAVSTATAVNGPSTAVGGTPVTFTVNVTSPQGTPSSGTVNLTANGTSIGSATVTNGVATLTTSSLPVGPDSIVASFAASSLYPASTSSAFSITITPAPSFSLATTSQALSIAQGQTGTLSFTITPVGGFANAISFACAGLPSYATCAFSPSTVTPGAGAIPVTLTVATNVQTAAMRSAPNGVWLAGGSLVGLCVVFLRRRRHAVRGVMLGLAVMLAASGLQGCSSGSSAAKTTPVGSYNVTVTATSGVVMQTLPITVSIH